MVHNPTAPIAWVGKRSEDVKSREGKDFQEPSENDASAAAVRNGLVKTKGGEQSIIKIVAVDCMIKRYRVAKELLLRRGCKENGARRNTEMIAAGYGHGRGNKVVPARMFRVARDGRENEKKIARGEDWSGESLVRKSSST